MKASLLLLLLLLPACAAAQGLGPLADPDRPYVKSSWISAGYGYSAAEGLDHRSGSVSANTLLGRGLSLESGFAYHRILHDGWLPGELYSAGLRLNVRDGANSFSGGVRSSSDRLFYSAHETDLALNVSHLLSSNGPHRLAFGLAYSSRRSFARGLPFPYLFYSYRSDKFTFNLPFSASWRPSKEYEFSAGYVPPKYCQAGVTRKLSERLRLKAEYSFSALQFDLAGRPDTAYSTFIEQKNAGLWTYYDLSPKWHMALWTGWALAGRYYNGKTYRDQHDERRIGASPSVSLNFTRSF